MSEYANLPPSPADTIYVVEVEVDPPIEGEREAGLVTIQPDAEQARKRAEVHFAMMDRVVLGEPEVTPIDEHGEFDV